MEQLLILVFACVLIYLATRESNGSTSGSWNPDFKDAGGLIENVTYTGNYNRSGKIIFFCVNVAFNSLVTLGTTQFQITLPYPARQTFTSRGGTLHNPTIDARYHIAGIVDTISVDRITMKFYYSGSTTDLPWKFNTPVGWTGGTSTSTHFDVSGFYEIEN